MEISSLGQFSTRLSHVLNIHRYLLMSNSESAMSNVARACVISILWNTYCYYNQFTILVDKKIKTLRAPIEKKMKDFVKISRWNDGSYFALRDSIQKSHSTLRKFIKEFDDILNMPVQSAFTDKEDPMTGKKIRRIDGSAYITSCNPCGSSKKISKINEIVNNIVLTDTGVYEEQKRELHELKVAVIDRVQEFELISKNVPESPYEKRKKMLHNIHNQKRSHLAELFKALQQQYGLSFQKGNIFLNQQKDQAFVESFTIQPVDLVGGWSQFDSTMGPYVKADASLINAWKVYGSLFYKCICRVNLMMKSFDNPSKELGLNIIVRCKGFLGHFMQVLTTQKINIAEFSKQLWRLRESIRLTKLQGAQEFDRERVCDVERRLRETLVVLRCFTEREQDTLKFTDEALKKITVAKRSQGTLTDVKEARECLKQAQNVSSGFNTEIKECMALLDMVMEDARERKDKKISGEDLQSYNKMLKHSILLTYQKLSKLSGKNQDDKMNVKEISFFNLNKINKLVEKGASQEFLCQYVLLAQYYLNLFVGLHGEAAKCVSVLAGVFTQLATKVSFFSFG